MNTSIIYDDEELNIQACPITHHQDQQHLYHIQHTDTITSKFLNSTIVQPLKFKMISYTYINSKTMYTISVR